LKTLTSIFIALKVFIKSGNYWKLVGIGFLVTFAGLLFGMAFLLIFAGIFSLLLRWTPYWRPANKLFGKLSLADSDELLPLKGWKLTQFILVSVPPILLIIGGIYILGRTGFENQNLFHMLINR
jgi:hypothetical protein